MTSLENAEQFVLSPLEKYLKVTVIRTTVQLFHPEVTIITRKGISNTLRTANDGFLNIGRQLLTETGERPNDLVLPPTDRAISRSHCKINYSPFFDTTIPDTWVAFVMAHHPRLGTHSFLQFLPLEILRYILLFIKEPKLPLLIDLGSMCGTYIKVSNVFPSSLEKGDNFLIGNDVIIEIDSIFVKKCLGKNLKKFEEFANSTLQKDDERNNDGNGFIVIKVTKYNGDNEETIQSNTYKFDVVKENQQVTIGRSQICDIRLEENTISRTQCRVIFTQGKWVIMDGIENKATVNGTWKSICKTNRVQRTPSEPFPIQNGTQIKISDTVLQVDWE